MRVHLMVGPGWNPFAPLPGDAVARVETEGSDRLDHDASAARLGAALRRLVEEEFPDATIEILPPDTAEGEIAEVAFEAGDADRFEDLTGVAPDRVGDPATDGPAMVREAIWVLLGEALETRGWRVQRPAR